MFEYKAINSVRRIRKRTKVYNFDVPKYETYVANGFIVHNCQNHKVSQQTVGKSVYYSPRQLVELAVERQVQGIAFTYNEPIIYHDYIEEVGHEIGRRLLDLKLVIKTNGFARPWVVRNLCLYAHGINVDLKGDNEDYERICGGWLEPVGTTIEWIMDMEVHLEISYLVLPSKIKDEGFNVYFRNWLADIDPNIPLHLLYFYPFHRMVVPTYKPSELLQLRELFREKLNHVYISNHFADGSSKARHTYCPSCETRMIVRQRGTTISHLNCCGTDLVGVFS